MRFDQLYSSSSGNLYTVTANNGSRLLIECGVPWGKLQKALGYNLTKIAGCLITHEHKDHCKSVKEVTKNGIDAYASYGTHEANEPFDICYMRRFKTVKPNDVFAVGTFSIYAFATHHDAREPLGFVIAADKEYMLFATDTSHITQRFMQPFSIIAIECSYDKDVLSTRVETGDINESLAKRLLTSHMEWRQTQKYLKDHCNLSKCREIHLLHMSADNIGDKEAVRARIEAEFAMPEPFDSPKVLTIKQCREMRQDIKQELEK